MGFHENAEPFGRILSIIPWIRHFFPKTSGYEPIYKSNVKFYKFVESIVDKHLADYVEGQENSFLDLYIQEMKKDTSSKPAYHSMFVIIERIGNKISAFYFPQKSSLLWHSWTLCLRQ